MSEYTLKKKNQTQVSEYKDLFKKLIIGNFIIFILAVVWIFFFQSAEVQNISSHLFKNSSMSEGIITGVLAIAHLISFYLLFTFKKIGISIFSFSLIGILILGLFEPQVFDGIDYTLDAISNIISGGILILIYFTNLNKEFN